MLTALPYRRSDDLAQQRLDDMAGFGAAGHGGGEGAALPSDHRRTLSVLESRHPAEFAEDIERRLQS